MILCVGEILADMIGEKKRNGYFYERKAGGAPFNVACAVKKLGGSVAFAGAVGNDPVGDFLKSYAENKNFDELLIPVRKNKNTTLAFVEISDDGERTFGFYRKNTADSDLPQISDELLRKANIVHFGSLMLSEKAGFDYALKLANRAKEAGKLVSFDVNYRGDVFGDEKNATKAYLSFLPLCDIIKFSEDETELFGEDYIERKLKNSLVLITRGAKGCEWRHNGRTERVKTIQIKPVDTTGAGDAFLGGALFGLDKEKTVDLSAEKLEKILFFANVCGSLNTLGRGATDSLPTRQKIAKYL